jgi:hypothetical protein
MANERSLMLGFSPPRPRLQHRGCASSLGPAHAQTPTRTPHSQGSIPDVSFFLLIFRLSTDSIMAAAAVACTPPATRPTTGGPPPTAASRLWSHPGGGMARSGAPRTATTAADTCAPPATASWLRAQPGLGWREVVRRVDLVRPA